MTIKIAHGLEASPDEIGLPGTTTLRQRLQCLDHPSEHVVIEYRLSANHNIWFDDGGPTKSITVTNDVLSAGTNCDHDVHLIKTHPSTLASVQVDEIITEQDGHKRTDLCLIGIKH